MKWTLVAFLIAFALVAAACGGNDDSDEVGDMPDSGEPADEPAAPADEPADEPAAPADEPADEPAAPADEPADEPAAPAEEEAAPDDSGAEPTPTPTPVVLTASFRGVTETTIKVGVTVPDFDALHDAGIPNYQGDHGLAFQAFFDKINAEGGILGRQIEPVYATFNFLLPVSQEEACLKIAEDEEVFIVFQGMLRDANLCFPEQYDTLLISERWITTGLQERAGDTVWLQTTAMSEAATAIMAQVLAESGRLDGKTIAIVGNNANTPEQLETLQAVLADLGFDAQTVMLSAALNDRVATDEEVRILAERFSADGVDFIFEIIGGGTIVQTMADEGYTPEWAHSNLQAIVDGTDNRAYVNGNVSVSQIPSEAMFENPDFQERCMSVFREAYPELEPETAYLPTGDQQAAGEPNWVAPIQRACNQTRLFKAIAELAGANLTNDSFRQALDQLGPFELIGVGQATYNSDSKWDGLDEFYLQTYDYETDSILIGDESIIIDRN
ncbi:MAG: ABC transporter substrate-binding protein [bacterium]|nr:ABC transporter substrate-binding protein [bacterium]MYG59646.1 ABC transporter substrate-binding protein [Acidimicrobiia bacterium]